MIGGHKKAVSYVRWMDGSRLISASTDNQLKLWDINGGVVFGASHHDRRPINVLSGVHQSSAFSLMQAFNQHASFPAGRWLLRQP